MKYNFESKQTVGIPGEYVLNIACQKDTYAASFSSNIINIFSSDSHENICKFSEHQQTITEVKYSRLNQDILYSSSLDGTIRVWDTREKKSIQKFVDDSNGSLKPITTFDVSLNENYICGGTEIIREDAFLLFWDRRTSGILGGYWNSHMDDITQVRFHPHKPFIMASGSVDGLINIFDLSKTCEDDALLNTLNTESSVSKLIWKAKPNEDLEKSLIGCLTHTENVQLWTLKDTEPSMSRDRDHIKQKNKNGTAIDYLIDLIHDESYMYLASGNNNGVVNLWKIEDNDVILEYTLDCGHSDVVRTLLLNSMNKSFFTGSEDGTICLWKKSTTNKTNFKVASHVKNVCSRHSTKPY